MSLSRQETWNGFNKKLKRKTLNDLKMFQTFDVCNPTKEKTFFEQSADYKFSAPYICSLGAGKLRQRYHKKLKQKSYICVNYDRQ